MFWFVFWLRRAYDFVNNPPAERYFCVLTSPSSEGGRGFWWKYFWRHFSTNKLCLFLSPLYFFGYYFLQTNKFEFCVASPTPTLPIIFVATRYQQTFCGCEFLTSSSWLTTIWNRSGDAKNANERHVVGKWTHDWSLPFSFWSTEPVWSDIKLWTISSKAIWWELDNILRPCALFTSMTTNLLSWTKSINCSYRICVASCYGSIRRSTNQKWLLYQTSINQDHLERQCQIHQRRHKVYECTSILCP